MFNPTVTPLSERVKKEETKEKEIKKDEQGRFFPIINPKIQDEVERFLSLNDTLLNKPNLLQDLLKDEGIILSLDEVKAYIYSLYPIYQFQF